MHSWQQLLPVPLASVPRKRSLDAPNEANKLAKPIFTYYKPWMKVWLLPCNDTSYKFSSNHITHYLPIRNVTLPRRSRIYENQLLLQTPKAILIDYFTIISAHKQKLFDLFLKKSFHYWWKLFINSKKNICNEKFIIVL